MTGTKRLQVRHYPQIPCSSFCVNVADEVQAKLVEETLANQHLWLYEHNIIPDYANAISVVMWDEDIDPDEKGEHWTDYYNYEHDMGWDEYKETFLK